MSLKAVFIDAFETLKLSIEDARSQAVTAKTEAETAKTAAETAETNAGNSATAADTAKTASETARDKSQDWAEKDTDVEVEAGAFSSKHHATKSGESATASDTSKTESVTAKNKAEEWAEKAEDTEVEVGQFSSKHHAIKSEASASSASSSASSASGSASAADTSKTGAETEKTGSETARDKSQKWAEEFEDVEVEPGKFSSLHHSLKSEDHKLLAQTAATASAGYRDESAAFADISAAYANFKGIWADLTGALTVPSSVFHDGTYWQLMVDIADVTLSEPTDVNTDWEPIGASVTSVNGKTGVVILNTNDLSDVELTGISRKEYLEYSTVAGKFVNRLPVEFKKVRNNTGSTIPKGTLVNVTGNTGVNPLITIADKDTDNAVSGILIQDILTGEDGLMQLQGTIQESFISTTGMTGSDILYLGSAGAYTNVKPITGNIIPIGIVGVVNPSNGSILLDCPAITSLERELDTKANLAGGSDANFTLMPQVGGNPIVESGSNSDGEWIRFSDGTQIVYKIHESTPIESLTTSGITVHRLANTLAYPAVFTAIKGISLTDNNSTDVNAGTDATRHTWVGGFSDNNAADPSLTQWYRPYVMSLESGQSKISRSISLQAIGKWF